MLINLWLGGGNFHPDNDQTNVYILFQLMNYFPAE